MPLSDLQMNCKLVEQGAMVIRKEDHSFKIKQFKKSTKPGTSGNLTYGWCKYMNCKDLNHMLEVWNDLISKGAIEG